MFYGLKAERHEHAGATEFLYFTIAPQIRFYQMVSLVILFINNVFVIGTSRSLFPFVVRAGRITQPRFENGVPPRNLNSL